LGKLGRWDITAHGSEREHKMEITFSDARGPNKGTVTRGQEARKSMIVEETSDIRARLTADSRASYKRSGIVGSPVHSARPSIRKCRQSKLKLPEFKNVRTAWGNVESQSDGCMTRVSEDHTVMGLRTRGRQFMLQSGG
jgi:hypothetical protein